MATMSAPRRDVSGNNSNASNSDSECNSKSGSDSDMDGGDISQTQGEPVVRLDTQSHPQEPKQSLKDPAEDPLPGISAVFARLRVRPPAASQALRHEKKQGQDIDRNKGDGVCVDNQQASLKFKKQEPVLLPLPKVKSSAKHQAGFISTEFTANVKAGQSVAASNSISQSKTTSSTTRQQTRPQRSRKRKRVARHGDDDHYYSSDDNDDNTDTDYHPGSATASTVTDIEDVFINDSESNHDVAVDDMKITHGPPSESEIRHVLTLLTRHFSWDAATFDNSHAGSHPPSLLDVLVRTILSQATTDVLSGRAFAALKEASGGSYSRLLNDGEEALADVIRIAGLAQSKARTIMNVLRTLATEQRKRRADMTTPRIGTSKTTTKEEEEDPSTQTEDLNQSLEYLRDDERFREDDGLVVRELTRFPGVGDKTAACVLLFGMRRAAFPVDTHVRRVVERLGWMDTVGARRPGDGGKARAKGAEGGMEARAKSKVTPEMVHAMMQERVPREWDTRLGLHLLLIRIGKTVCKAGAVARLRCAECPLREVCVTGRGIGQEGGRGI